MAIFTRFTVSLSFVLSVAAFAADPAKAPPKERGTSAAPSSTASQAPLQNAKAKKKKLLRPGVEWEPAPAPLKW